MANEPDPIVSRRRTLQVLGIGGMASLAGCGGGSESAVPTAEYFDETVNRGRLQRAKRPPSRDEAAEKTLPLPPMAGGEHGQAAVYNAEIESCTDAGEWTVTDGAFHTGPSLYLANQ